MTKQQLIHVGVAGQVGDGVHGHHVYGVTSQLHSIEPVTINRRYSDFTWLSTRLSCECLGYVIPPLPEKAVNALQGAAFLEVRRYGLSRFITAIQKHEVLSTSLAFKQFLTCGAVEFTAIKTAIAAANATPYTVSARAEVLSSWWKKTYQRLSENQQVQNILVHKENSTKSEMEMEFESILLYVGNLLTELKNLQARAETVYRNGYTLATSFYELSASIGVLSDSEQSEVGMSTANLHAVEPILKERARQVECEMYPFMESISYYAKCVVAVQAVLKVREELRFAHLGAIAALKKSNNSEMHSPSHVAECTRKVEESQRTFEKVHLRVMKEVVRFRNEKPGILRTIFFRMAELQMEYNTEMVKTLAMSIPVISISDLDIDDDDDNDLQVEKKQGTTPVQQSVSLRPPPPPLEEKEQEVQLSFTSTSSVTGSLRPAIMTPVDSNYTDVAL